jgi:hypothetical protein
MSDDLRNRFTTCSLPSTNSLVKRRNATISSIDIVPSQKIGAVYGPLEVPRQPAFRLESNSSSKQGRWTLTALDHSEAKKRIKEMDDRSDTGSIEKYRGSTEKRWGWDAGYGNMK